MGWLYFFSGLIMSLFLCNSAFKNEKKLRKDLQNKIAGLQQQLSDAIVQKNKLIEENNILIK